MEITARLLLISLLVYVMNIPFGYWRANVRKLSVQWFLAIHIPVPIIVVIRIFSGIGFHWITYVFMVAGFFLGQFTGTKLYTWRQKHHYSTSSCLVMDLFRH